MHHFSIYTDGGGEKSSSGGAACIIDDVERGTRQRLVAVLGGATNNEAEITAGLLAFSHLRVQAGEKAEVRWFADSEYVLKSATGYIKQWQRNGWRTASKDPVKNQGLWRAYLHLSGGYRIAPEHVRGHSGHPENEECDTASTWAQGAGNSDGPIESEVEIPSTGGAWQVLDLRVWLKQMRGENLGEEHFEWILNFIQEGGKPPGTYDPLPLIYRKIAQLADETDALAGRVSSEKLPLLESISKQLRAIKK